MTSKSKLCLALLGVLLTIGAAARTISVMSAPEGAPIAGATIFGHSGRIVGITDSIGNLQVAPSEFPVTATCIGYASAASASDTILLSPKAFDLDVVDVDPAARPIQKLTFYAREYFTGAAFPDTVLNFSEYVAQIYLAPKDTKGYKSEDASPKIRNARHYMRHIFADGRDSVALCADADMSEAMFQLSMPIPPVVKLTKPMLQGATTDVKAGKYGPQMYLHSDGNLLTIKYDALSDFKNHSFSPWILKLLGLTMEIDRLDVNLAYGLRPGQAEATICDLIEGSFGLHIVGKGKWIKKSFRTKQDVGLECLVEIWPMDAESLTLDEYRQQRREDTTIPFPTDLKDVPPLPEAYRSIVVRCANTSNP